MGGNVAAGVFWLFVAWAIAAAGLVLALIARAVAPSERRLGCAGALASAALLVNGTWVVYAVLEIADWYAGQGAIFAYYWVGNVLAAAAAAAAVLFWLWRSG